MSVVKPSSVLGYVEWSRLDPNPEVAAILAYLEWVGTPSPISLTEDSQVNAVSGYIEWIEPGPNPEPAVVMGYVEYVDYDPTPTPQTVLAYLEWIGTPSPLALTEDAQVNTVSGYIEYIWDGKTPSTAVTGFGPALWMIT